MDAKTKPNLLDESTYPSIQGLIDNGDDARLRDFHLDLTYVGPQDSDGSTERPHSNTAPTTLQKEPGSCTKPQPLEVGGYDTLEILVYGRWEQCRFELLTRQLDRAKHTAQQAEFKDRGCLLTLAGEAVMVQSHGAKHGLRCPWMFIWQGMRFAIVNRLESSKTHYSVLVIIGSLACMEKGGPACWHEAQRLLNAIGFQVESNKITRADLCVDLADVDTNEMATAYNEYRFIARARDGDNHTSGYSRTGFRRGNGQRILIRVYDKLHELGDSQEDCFKKDVLKERRWGGLYPQHATRVEFQLRRDALVDFSVDSVENLFCMAGDITAWLTHKWFRLTDEVPDRNHTDRATISVVWQKVQSYFATAFGPGSSDGVKCHPRRRMTIDAQPLVRQAIGCTTSALACCGILPRTKEEFFAAVLNLFRPEVACWLSEVWEKRAALETHLPGAVSAEIADASEESKNDRQEILRQYFSEMATAVQTPKDRTE